MQPSTAHDTGNEPGSPAELAAFAALQARLPDLWQRVINDPLCPQTVVVVPSLSVDGDELTRIAGAIHYEERLLCLLMLLRMPRTQLVYVTSTPIDDAVVDYYLHLLPGIPASHARRRLHMVSVDDASLTPLSAKLLARPDLLADIREGITNDDAHLTCFASTPLERTLAVRLGLPLFAPDPDLAALGEKSMGRQVLQAAGLRVPVGIDGITDRFGLAAAVRDLLDRRPGLQRLVVKVDEGFSGEGNAILDVTGLDVTDPRVADGDAAGDELVRRIAESLDPVADGMTAGEFLDKFDHMGGVVEELIEGDDLRSPSVQVVIDPPGDVGLVSTHDQVLGGPANQVFLGCTFPADDAYRTDLHDAGLRAGRELAERGVIGRFAVDFVSVRRGEQWEHYAIEINLRKGGTTLPYMMLEFLTNGSYGGPEGDFRTRTGLRRCYYATDNLVDPAYVGLTPADLIDLLVLHGLGFDSTEQIGVVFHLIGAITTHGKIGVVSIAETTEEARAQYESTVAVLDAATRARSITP